MKKINVALILSTDLATGRGTEVTALKYITFFDRSKFNLMLVHTDFLKTRRINDSTIKVLTKDIKLLRIKSYEWIYHFISKRTIPLYLIYLAKYQIIKLAVKIQNRRKMSEIIENNDILYFFTNEYATYFKKENSVFIGTNHTNFPATNPSVANLESKMINLNIIHRKFDAFHLFPKTEQNLIEIPRRPYFTLESGVDTDFFKPNPCRIKNSIKFLFVAHLSKSKGVLTLLEAWENIKNRDEMELHIIGGGELSNQVKNTKGVKYHGIVSDEKLQSLYSDSDIFVYPSRADNFPIVVTQALSSGLYVLVSDSLKGNFDLFEKEGHLKYVEARASEFCNEMVKAAERIKVIREKVFDLHDLVGENLDWRVIVNRLFTEFEKAYWRSREL